MNAQSGLLTGAQETQSTSTPTGSAEDIPNSSQMISRSCYWAAFGAAFASRVIGGLFSNTPRVGEGQQTHDRAPGPHAIPVEKRSSEVPAIPDLASVNEDLSSASISLPRKRPEFWARVRQTVSGWVFKLRLFLHGLSARKDGVWEYALVTASYWGMTITDGAIRMLILFQFYLMGYSAFQIASLFLFYEIFGVITNLFGGWIGANTGIRVTMFGGIGLQIVALIMLGFLNPAWPTGVVVAYVMVSQALSGIAKDLTKMSSKSAIKALVPPGADKQMYKWVSLLTGSKNALKGAGFFVGALLLTLVGFNLSLWIMAAGLAYLLAALWHRLPHDMGKTKEPAKFKAMFSMDRRVNILSAARFFLFGARDVWFVVALPVYMSVVFGWSPVVVGGYLALWTIGYGIVQSLAPKFVAAKKGETPKAYTVTFWATVLTAVPTAIAVALMSGTLPGLWIVGGLAVFGVVFAINSAVHSYMIVHYAESEKVAMTIGFYYMANAGGRLAGTLLSGWVYQAGGIVSCLWLSAAFVGASALISGALLLPYERKALEVKSPLGLLGAGMELATG